MYIYFYIIHVCIYFYIIHVCMRKLYILIKISVTGTTGTSFSFIFYKYKYNIRSAISIVHYFGYTSLHNNNTVSYQI